jgi:hypothetical protein
MATSFLFLSLAAVAVAGCGGDDTAAGDACADPERNVAPGSLQFNAECCANEDCADGTCGDFNQKGMRCTKACSADTDCAGLGEGRCGGSGRCAVPD